MSLRNMDIHNKGFLLRQKETDNLDVFSRDGVKQADRQTDKLTYNKDLFYSFLMLN